MICDEFPGINYLKSSVKSALVERFKKGDERPCNDNDFSETREIREKLTSDLKCLMDNFVRSNSCNSKDGKTHLNLDNESLALIIILCGQNTVIHPWNTEATVKNCEDILAQILILLNCEDATELISGNCKINLTKVVLQVLCTDLTASTWKEFPASVACYKWILDMIKQPHLSQHLHFVLPPALLLTDDFVKENRIGGAQCLNHIVQNITIAELQFGGYGNVIYNALLPMLRIREADIIQSIIPPLVLVTTKLDYDLGKKDPKKWSKFDEILEIFLENMELENILDLRHCYINNLNLLISASGCGITRWSKRLLRIFDEYIQTAGIYNNLAVSSNCVKAIEKFIDFSSDVSPYYAGHLLFTLLMAFHSTDSCNIQCNDIQKKSKEVVGICIKKLLLNFPQNEREILEKDLEKNLSSNVNFNKFYKKVLDIL